MSDRNSKRLENSTESFYEYDSQSGLYRPPRARETSQSNDNDWKAAAHFWISLATLLLLGATAYYTREQWKEAAQTAKASVESAKASTEQAALIKREIEGSLQAVVQERVSLDAGGNGLFVELANRGRVISPVILLDLDVFKGDYDKLQRLPVLRHMDMTINQLRPVPEPDVWGAATQLLYVGRREFESIGSFGKHTYVVAGHVKFDDGFDHLIDRHVCWIYARIPGAFGFTQVEGMMNCENFAQTLGNYKAAQPKPSEPIVTR